MSKHNQELVKRVADRLGELADEIEFLRSEEEDYMWNMPENLQNSDRYYDAEAAESNLSDAHDCLDDAQMLISDLLETEVAHE